MTDYDIKSLVEEMDFEKGAFQTTPNILMLTNYEIDVLKRNQIDYLKCQSLKEILFEVEEIIASTDIIDEDLEKVSQTIAERDYYENTHH